MDNQILTVNHLPSLTWRRLGVNSARVTLRRGEMPISGASSEISGFSGVSEETVPESEAGKRFPELLEPVPEEHFVAGKFPIYASKEGVTALGEDFSRFLAGTADAVGVIDVPAGAQPDGPVVISQSIGDGTGAFQRILHAGEGSSVTVILVSRSAEGAAGTLADGIRILAEKDAKVKLVRVNLLGAGCTALSDTGARLGDRAEFDYTEMNLGGRRSYTGCYVDQQGNESKFHMHTGYAAAADHLVDMNYVTVQRGRKTESTMQVTGVLADRAEKVFRGTIDFRNGSSGSSGDEQEDVLLLDETVVNRTVPVILCEEEDVDGRHGATIGRLPEDVLFYLGTRGISEQEAERLMVLGRLGSVARLIPCDAVRDEAMRFVSERFADEESTEE